MAYDVSKLAKLAALKALAEKVKSDYATKADLKKASDSAAAAFKSGKVDGNTVSLYEGRYPPEFRSVGRTRGIRRYARAADEIRKEGGGYHR